MKRSRAPNFTNAEIMHLLLIVEKYPIIENKRTDAATSTEKLDAWKALAVEYNSTTAAGPRSAENLMACYKNQKSKVKKHHSSEKMNLKAPVTQQYLEDGPSHRSDNIQIILDAVEENGQDWESVSQATNISSEDCKSAFKNLVKIAKKEDVDFVKKLKRTGGGPPPQPPNDLVLEKVKTLMGPSLEGLYTIYGGDTEFMRQQQECLPAKKQSCPIDLPSPNITEDDVELISAPTKTKECEYSTTPISRSKIFIEPARKRLDLLKKKNDPALETSLKQGKKIKTSDTFLELAKEKLELIIMKKKIADDQLLHQQITNAFNLDIIKEKLEFERQSNAIELEFQKTKKEMEISFLKQKYEFELNLLRKTQ